MHNDNPSKPPYEIRGWDTGCGAFDMEVRVNGYCFSITVSPDNFVESPRALTLFNEIYEKIIAGNDHEPEVWSYSGDIADVFVPVFTRLAPSSVHTGKLTLADLKLRGRFDCEYRVIKEKPYVGAVTPHVPEYFPDDGQGDYRLPSNFPSFPSDKVEVPYSDGRHVHSIIPQKVYIHGRKYFYKECWSPEDALDVVDKYSKIANTDLSQRDLRTPRLFGIVTDDDGQAMGLVYEWIESRNKGTLSSVIEETPASQRGVWASQIQRTVAQLHKLGVVWGDVKADNVLIDKDNNAVIIDLEGGTTRGWVERELGGSIEGDLQGLGRLVDFVLNDESPLRADFMSDEDGSNTPSED